MAMNDATQLGISREPRVSSRQEAAGLLADDTAHDTVGVRRDIPAAFSGDGAVDSLRLLAWTGEGGKPCYLSADGGDSFMSCLADNLESDHLGMAEDLHVGTRMEEEETLEGMGASTPNDQCVQNDPPSTLVHRWRRDPRTVGRARRLLLRHLNAWDMEGLADTAELVVSELVTNAVQHAHGPDDALVETRFERLPSGALRIEVHDVNGNRPELRRLSADAESGRGLALVEALTGGRWGVSGREGVGKLLWAECAADDGSGEKAEEVRGGRKRERPHRLYQEPEAVTWAREKCGLTKRGLAELVGISEQLMGEVESGWRSATPANLAKIAQALNCPIVVLERKRSGGTGTRIETAT